MPASLSDQIAATVQALQALVGMEKEIHTARDLILKTLRAGGKLIVCGNGGSAAEATHLTTELVGRYAKNRKSLPAVTLSADGALMSCIGNDFGFDEVFARALEGLANPNDLLVAITSSGNSANIVKALEKAKHLGLSSLALLGKGGGKCKGLATVEIIPAGTLGRTAQEAHLFLIHFFCEAIDEEV